MLKTPFKYSCVNAKTDVYPCHEIKIYRSIVPSYFIIFQCYKYHSYYIYLVNRQYKTYFSIIRYHQQKQTEVYYPTLTYKHVHTIVIFILKVMGSPCGVEANVLDCIIIRSEFEFQLCYYVHFWTNTFGKGKNLFIPPIIG